jgi:HK97 family phage major capsid protein
MSKADTQIRTLVFEAAERATDGRIPVVVSTDDVVEVIDGPEVLMHTADAVDLTRAPLPIIVTHQSGQLNVGVVEDISLQGGVMRGFARFGKRAEAAQYEADVVGNIIKAVSVGYRRFKAHMRSDGVMVTTRWMPTHVALVGEPADAGAGFYRAAVPEFVLEEFSIEKEPQPTRAAESPAGAAGTPSLETTMSEIITDPAPVTAPAAARSIEVMPGNDPLAGERERAREILAIGRAHNMGDLADKAIDAGTSLDSFRAMTLQRLKDSGVLRAAESPEIGMSKKDVEQFSFCRVMLAAADPMNAARIAPFEMEASRSAQDRRGDSRKDREHAITVPADVLSRAMALSPEMLSSAQRMMMAQRALVVGTPTAGGNFVATDLLGASFIDLLRNAMVLDRLGITWLRDLNGNIAIPSQSGAATGYWVAENGAPTESQQTVGQVTLTPKTVGAFTDFSRRLLLQSSLDVEAFVRADLAATLGQMLQAAAINGSGASNQPTGILNASGIGAVVGGTNGIAPTYDHMVDLESAVANVNADMGNLAFLTNTKVRGKLRKTQEFASTNGKPVWTSSGQAGVGDVLGYQALTSNSVPSNLDKGTSVGVASAAIFGNWSELIIGMWGGLDIMLDPYTGATSGTKRVVALQDVDVALRRAASFAVFKDILTA